jgi:hypothetical protein
VWKKVKGWVRNLSKDSPEGSYSTSCTSQDGIRKRTKIKVWEKDGFSGGIFVTQRGLIFPGGNGWQELGMIAGRGGGEGTADIRQSWVVTQVKERTRNRWLRLLPVFPPELRYGSSADWVSCKAETGSWVSGWAMGRKGESRCPPNWAVLFSLRAD